MNKLLITITICISFIISKTIVYKVEPLSNRFFITNQVEQLFIANVDSIGQVDLYLSQKPTLGHYVASITEEDNVFLNGKPARKYYSNNYNVGGFIRFEFIPKIPVRKGFSYRLQVSHTSSPQIPIVVFYNDLNPYPLGKMKGLDDTLADLAVSIIGTNNVVTDMFSMNSCMTVTTHEQPRLFRYQEQWKICVDSMRTMGITWDRPGHCAWQHFQFDTLNDRRQKDTIFIWDWCDSLMSYYARDSINVLWLFTQSTHWSSCDIKDSNGWYDGLPKNLFEPVINHSGDINSNNYFACYVYKFVKRYGPNGEFWRNKKRINPILYYEMWNEPEWALQNYWSVDSIKDITDPIYRRLLDSLGPKESLMSIYARLCIVGDSAAKKASPDAKTIVYIPFRYWEKPPLIDTQEWLSFLDSKKVYDYCEGLSFHTYALDSNITPMPPPYFHIRQKLNLDSLWKIIKCYKNFKAKSLWCTEFGTGYFPNTVKDTISNNLFEKQAILQFKTIVMLYVNTNPIGPLNNSFLWAYSTRYFPDVWGGQRISITRDSFSCRPTGYAYRQLSSMLKGYKFVSIVSENISDSIRLYKFENILNGHYMYIAWKEWNPIKSKISIKLPIRTKTALVYQVALSKVTQYHCLLTDRNGFITMTLDSLPVMIVEPANFILQSPDMSIEKLWVDVNDVESLKITAIVKNIGNISTPDSMSVNIFVNEKLKYSYKNKYSLKSGQSLKIITPKILFNKKNRIIIKVSINTPALFVEKDYSNNIAYLYY